MRVRLLATGEVVEVSVEESEDLVLDGPGVIEDAARDSDTPTDAAADST